MSAIKLKQRNKRNKMSTLVKNPINKLDTEVTETKIVTNILAIDALKWLRNHMSTDRMRDVLGYLNVDAGWITATDGHRLAQYRQDAWCDNPLADGNYIIASLTSKSATLCQVRENGLKYPNWQLVVPNIHGREMREIDGDYASKIASIYRHCSNDDITYNPLFLRDALSPDTGDKSLTSKRFLSAWINKMYFTPNDPNQPVLLAGDDKRVMVMPKRARARAK